ncbi:MAG: 3-hydroxyisobutyrate dehydrogenase [Rhodospirillales bacterium]|nr:3-hydroxyisobutyrate dehydrogenase [Rhodospirillales bacterium]MDH3791496.1 3-hydroxyisobutyrate dehydrogenase [Rhodospirillales bacterium]MDH3909847.1 3-hydroxyisobutyrate dehydrogenase [Rhodospirillales bacterium]MDH3917139.1 3-hydroxyisobutyrate dehydrogenase [Rhodospirillales bacterium]MDH3966234.1 3-hydroxyisobutyrate dehydrogenase [Rhodospirillales bacterium]
MADIGFIGLGNMGVPMAANLVQAGHRVRGFDLVPTAVEAAAAKGVETAASAAEAVQGAETIVTMLPAGEQVRAAYLGEAGGEGGLIAAAGPDSLLIDSSTIDVASAREVHEAAAAAGHPMLDAPVSGGVAGAEAATLTFMCGGPDAAFARARPLLEVMGRNIVHAGGPGNGQAAKVCNNMILGISMLACAEAFTLGEKLGLDPKTLFEISSVSSGACWAMLNHNPVPGVVETSAANRDYRPGFAAAMMHKDLKLSQTAASQAGAATPLGAAATALYTVFVNAGNGALDYSAIVKLIRGE